MNEIVVVGSGAWGSALAETFEAEIIAGRAEAKCDLSNKIVVIAVQAQSLREVLLKHNYENSIIVICSKGVEQGSLKLLSEVAEEILPDNKIAILSGPNFAEEIQKGLPAASTVSCKDEEIGRELIEKLGKRNFRLYYTKDIIGVQIAGAVKNVLAIACGICEGKKLGNNAKAAIITRGVAELARLCKAKGGDDVTLLSLAGIGDLLLTCTSTQSRNFSLGVEIAKSEDIQASIKEKGGVKEGYYTAKAVNELAKSLDVEMPICKSVFDILYKDKTVNDVINELLQRPQK